LVINSSNDAWSAGGVTLGITAVEDGDGAVAFSGPGLFIGAFVVASALGLSSTVGVGGGGDGDVSGPGLFVGVFVAASVLGLTSTVGGCGDGGGFFHIRKAP